MTDDAVALEPLQRAVAQLDRVVGAVRPEDAGLPTPCRSWTVQQVIGHVVHDLGQFTVAARGGEADYSGDPPTIAPAEWSDRVHADTETLLAAWREADDFGALGLQIPELTLHAWDIAQAAVPDAELDPDLAERSLAVMSGMLAPEYRGAESDGKSFGPEVAAPDDASAYERLAAFSGRQPR
ncbi:MAG TPA: TIGR03086 family metal-binding protein [Candidatus Nanopelagicales bacterium]|nr:TIGR03086 family metal-binding protein [Candidatus Nanopelagicales bacterium]